MRHVAAITVLTENPIKAYYIDPKKDFIMIPSRRGAGRNNAILRRSDMCWHSLAEGHAVYGSVFKGLYTRPGCLRSGLVCVLANRLKTLPTPLR